VTPLAPSSRPPSSVFHGHWRCLTAALLALLLSGCDINKPAEPIVVGVLHSLTGHMAISEAPLVDAIQLAIDDINAAGGVLGRPLQARLIDGKSDPQTFAAAAHTLISSDSVPVIFGCWTSACRKAVRPVIENFDHLLIYPVQYEGMEQSPNVVYTGAAPNQQIIPGIRWALENLGKRLFLIGSDYVFPRTANLIIRDLAGLQGAEVVAEHYLPLDADEFEAIIADIARLQPEVIVNSVNGSSNTALFAALRADPRTATIPVLSFSVSEAELASIGPSATVAHYAVRSYFQSLDNAENRAFIHRFQQRFGADRVIGDTMESAWIGVHLWAQAAQDAGSIDPAAVRQTIGRQSLSAPEGIVSVDADNQHLWKTVYIGEAQADGQFRIVWSSNQPIRPEPFPQYRSLHQWQERSKVQPTASAQR
jgi:urea transport system substrate-binding protein